MKAELKPEELAPQLRLGNLLIRPTINKDNASETIDLIMPVSHVDIRDAVHYGKDWNAKPIELSEEWLVKVGASKSFENWQYTIPVGAITLHFRCNTEWYSELGGIYLGSKIRYVHQLQNLYYALTGNELIFNHG